ncbi:kinesin-domain-containing protein [Durotheca rogersii]|uniref:kinesin-domain-containing protein n=1 Tax=Durotheca rogersii TaxID=419775 RepID=UPI00221F67AF|nr:kinesin-domain-containing protein [Durotheca rogersii]KAI5859789.1 kinesin-domain-containing protein [Durotheca rogersii]
MLQPPHRNIMSVRVVARIRPLLDKELDKDIIVRPASNDDGKISNVVKIPSPKNESEEFSFTFNGVYDQGTTQEELFSAEVAPHLKSLFQGLDVTIFAYGVTGTGKTHTMRGGLKLADRGVIPRLLSGVFRRAKKIAKDSDGETAVDVALSYYEIYNDKVFDLLEPPEKRTPSGLPLRAEANGKTVVAGLSERPCQDLKDFERLYIEANNNRITAATKLNAHSSRSHAILRVKLTQTTGDMIRESTASAIDLAGSEDNRRTENGKERLVESAAINKSLFVLSQCIDAISRGDRRIPFRESKMTRILSLGQNNGITIMILNLAPIRSYHLDTLSSLNVSSRAKRIEVREIENEVVFKQPPRTNSSSTVGMSRQPLRPLANAHNIHSGAAASKAADKPADRPVKAFNVYADRAKPQPISRPANTSVKRSSPSHKRPSDSDSGARPTKITRPEIPRPSQVPRALKPSQPAQSAQPIQPAISADLIEAMVEKKVSEILASRSRAEALPEINEEVQKRLEALEKRIEDGRHDDSRSDGLRFLLMARQHKERGEDASALKMYEMALPYFPGQAKLIAKMEKLKARLEAKRHGKDTTTHDSGLGEDVDERPVTAARKSRKPSSRPASVDEDDDYNGAEADDDEEDLTSKDRKKGTKKSRGGAAAAAARLSPKKSSAAIDERGPVVQSLLAIVNSRDVDTIMSLQGFGPKKARDLVAFLEEEDCGPIGSLAHLRTVPGMGGRAVDRAYEGLMSAARAY